MKNEYIIENFLRGLELYSEFPKDFFIPYDLLLNFITKVADNHVKR